MVELGLGYVHWGVTYGIKLTGMDRGASRGS